jgi:hypothetical protein
MLITVISRRSVAIQVGCVINHEAPHGFAPRLATALSLSSER